MDGDLFKWSICIFFGEDIGKGGRASCKTVRDNDDFFIDVDAPSLFKAQDIFVSTALGKLLFDRGTDEDALLRGCGFCDWSDNFLHIEWQRHFKMGVCRGFVAGFDLVIDVCADMHERDPEHFAGFDEGFVVRAVIDDNGIGIDLQQMFHDKFEFSFRIAAKGEKFCADPPQEIDNGKCLMFHQPHIEGSDRPVFAEQMGNEVTVNRILRNQDFG